MQDKESIQETWNKKRILIGGFFLILLGIGLFTTKKMFLDKFKNSGFTEKPAFPKRAVEGISSKNENNFDLSGIKNKDLPLSLSNKVNLQKKLDEIKQQVNSLNITDVASSSPQVQKIVNDFQSLQDLPKNQVKDACYNICKGL